MEPGVYKVTFKTGDYFKSQNMNTFFPVVPVIFNVTKQNQNCISRCCSVSTDTLPTAAADDQAAIQPTPARLPQASPFPLHNDAHA